MYLITLLKLRAKILTKQFFELCTHRIDTVGSLQTESSWHVIGENARIISGQYGILKCTYFAKSAMDSLTLKIIVLVVHR